MAINVRLRAGRHPDQRASCRRLLATQLLSLGDLVDRGAPFCRLPRRHQATIEAIEIASAEVVSRSSTTLGREARRAKAMGRPRYLPVDNVNGYCRPFNKFKLDLLIVAIS